MKVKETSVNLRAKFIADALEICNAHFSALPADETRLRFSDEEISSLTELAKKTLQGNKISVSVFDESN